MLRNVAINTFLHGLITSLEDRAIPRGAASSVKNWLTKGDRIELRLGMKRLGAEVTGNGRISGLHRTFRRGGTQVLYETHKRKLRYYDTATEAWVEVGTNILPSAASDENVTFGNYAGLAGHQMWLCSPNGLLLKIMTANRGDYSDLTLASKNYLGWIVIRQNRMLLWGRVADKTAPYMSYIDDQAFTTVTAENIGTGNGTTKTFTDTLDFKAAGARRTCFAVTATDGTETFTDDHNGALTGSLGGTGTINYTSGAISVTFNTAPANLQAITSTYQWEDSTNTGIADFTSSATRTAGQGGSFRQDDGGSPLQGIGSYENVEYCLHQKRTWSLKLTIDDTAAENFIFREAVGIPNLRAFYPAGEGIYYMDDSDEKDPKFRVLTFDPTSAKVLPTPISNNLDLSQYRFNRGVVRQWGELVLFCCRHVSHSYNDTMFIYNTRLKTWDKTDYIVSTLEEYNGALVSGDDIADNVYELFSGYDDDDSTIDNEWIGNLDNLNSPDLKKCRKIKLWGLTQADQDTEVWVSVDNGAFVKITTILGDGPYVDSGTKITVGSETTGRTEIGGGSPAAVQASPFLREVKLNQDNFHEIKIKFRAVGLGYCAISGWEWKDIVIKGQRIPAKYRTT